jgi:hypothetical protein
MLRTLIGCLILRSSVSLRHQRHYQSTSIISQQTQLHQHEETTGCEAHVDIANGEIHSNIWERDVIASRRDTFRNFSGGTQTVDRKTLFCSRPDYQPHLLKRPAA